MKKNINMFFMQEALGQAKKALKKKEVPVGAIVVGPDNKILSRAYNKIEKNGCQTGHAEILAIQKACKKLKTWRLDDCSIYITLEPCIMCFGLIQLSRIKNLYFGAKSQEFGSGISDLKQHKLYKKDLNIVAGLKEIESVDILKKFFTELRKLKKEKGLLCKKELRH
ncbi:MAG: Cytidine and deoxycytidylate deaminase zinc-binding region [candidate division TM6 bacterium GW2011_GWF2_28_16]|jgi:tRNA(Arg) A34 adenosine deaminase TadA|nr:MAG: Cytidine and deoxycytidylate deaminase zinc-binding region [candidate division TM6 bacterium GW2011_GWF2_28_16]